VSAVIRTVVDTAPRRPPTVESLTGGNARAVTPGETFSYQFMVPQSWQDLQVSTTFGHHPNSVIRPGPDRPERRALRRRQQ